MIKHGQLLSSISTQLSILSRNVEILNCISFYDINIMSENFYADLLNIIYGYKLENLNKYKKNNAAIDLGDVENKVCIQVTSDNGSEKIKYTISKFIENEQYKVYDVLIILLLTKKKNYSTKFETQNLFDFDKSKNILDYTDLITYLQTKNIKTLEKVSTFLSDNLVDHITDKIEGKASEVETIIGLIEFITKNRNGLKSNDNIIIDPEYKIKKRFKDFTTALEGTYTSLYPYYGGALDTVYSTLEIDNAQELITIMYLQNLSIATLDNNSNNPVKALNELVYFFEEQLGKNGKKYDQAAIRFYLINEMIKCNVFPNEESDYNVN